MCIRLLLLGDSEERRSSEFHHQIARRTLLSRCPETMPFTNTFVKVKSRWQLKTLHDSTVLYKNAAVYPSSSAMSSIPTTPSATNLVTSEGDENENEEEGNLLEELWPRETKPLLNYQVSLP